MTADAQHRDACRRAGRHYVGQLIATQMLHAIVSGVYAEPRLLAQALICRFALSSQHVSLHCRNALGHVLLASFLFGMPAAVMTIKASELVTCSKLVMQWSVQKLSKSTC